MLGLARSAPTDGSEGRDKKMAFNEKDYQAAYSIGLDALERLDKAKVDEMSGLAAMLTVCMSATYAMAPDADEAGYFIELARRLAVGEDGEAA
jgi:hypothetical protein